MMEERFFGSKRRATALETENVASMYPIEIDIARAIASGRSVSDVAWELFDEAAEGAGATGLWTMQ
jgi:hypothetical protein